MHSPRVLVVDDEQSVAEVFCIMLSVLGYTANHAQTAADAWKLFTEHGADAVLIDVNLSRDPKPATAGLELARAIKDSAPGTRVVMVSGESTAAIPQAWDAAILKPVPSRELRRTLEQLGLGVAGDRLPTADDLGVVRRPPSPM